MKKRQKRDQRSGRYSQDRTFYKILIYGIGIGSMIILSFVGVNTIFNTVREIMVVNDSKAEAITLTWQDEVTLMLRRAEIDVEYAHKIIFCESRWDKDTFHINKGSIDRGLWQINSFFHSEVSKDCSYDPVCATKEAIRIIKTHGWDEWVCNKYVQ